MNIIYLEHYAGSPEMGMEFRPYYLSREWVKMGHKVTIIAGDYSHLRNMNPSVDKDWITKTIDGIEYVWLKTGEYKGNGISRALTIERFVRKLYVNAKMIVQRWKPDVVIASSTYPLDTYPAQRISKLAKCEYIHEVHDMWPATLYEVGGMSRNHPFVIAMQIAENSAYKHCDKCVALLPYSKDYMVEHGLKPEKWVNIQNGVVEEEWENPAPLSEEYVSFFAKHKRQFIVGYFGGHALSNSLDTILDAAAMMEDKDTIFVFVGDGVEKNRLMNRAVGEQLSNVYFLDTVSKKCIPNLVRHFDCSIMTGKQSPLYKYGLCMNKMYDSMMAGKPIICAISAPETLVEEYECGLQVNSASSEAIVNALTKIKNMSIEERERMGENGKKAILDNFTYQILAKEYMAQCDCGR